MIVSICLALAIASAALLLFRASSQARRRNAQSWESIVARLRPGLNPADLSEEATPEQRWQQLDGARGLCVMFQNAKVMLEMASYAARNSDTVDPDLLANLRSDALQIRVLVLRALIAYALHQLNEGITLNAFRAASMYREMSGRMSAVLQVNHSNLVPQSIAVR
jgi:hypothetical protein